MKLKNAENETRIQMITTFDILIFLIHLILLCVNKYNPTQSLHAIPNHEITGAKISLTFISFHPPDLIDYTPTPCSNLLYPFIAQPRIQSRLYSAAAALKLVFSKPLY